MMPTPDGSILTHNSRETLSTRSIPHFSYVGAVFYACIGNSNAIKIPVVIAKRHV
jgi:hypothetical protein